MTGSWKIGSPVAGVCCRSESSKRSRVGCLVTRGMRDGIEAAVGRDLKLSHRVYKVDT